MLIKGTKGTDTVKQEEHESLSPACHRPSSAGQDSTQPSELQEGASTTGAVIASSAYCQPNHDPFGLSSSLYDPRCNRLPPEAGETESLVPWRPSLGNTALPPSPSPEPEATDKVPIFPSQYTGEMTVPREPISKVTKTDSSAYRITLPVYAQNLEELITKELDCTYTRRVIIPCSKDVSKHSYRTTVQGEMPIVYESLHEQRSSKQQSDTRPTESGATETAGRNEGILQYTIHVETRPIEHPSVWQESDFHDPKEGRKMIILWGGEQEAEQFLGKDAALYNITPPKKTPFQFPSTLYLDRSDKKEILHYARYENAYQSCTVTDTYGYVKPTVDFDVKGKVVSYETDPINLHVLLTAIPPRTQSNAQISLPLRKKRRVASDTAVTLGARDTSSHTDKATKPREMSTLSEGKFKRPLPDDSDEESDPQPKPKGIPYYLPRRAKQLSEIAVGLCSNIAHEPAI